MDGSSNMLVLHILNGFIHKMLCTLQGCKSGIFSHLHRSHSSSVPSSSKTSSLISDVQVSLTSNANEIDQLQNPSQVYSHAQSTNSSIYHCAPQLAHEATG
jgi:hypothetical protein